MTTLHTVPFHINDLLSDTINLSPAEFGAYMRLLCAHYRAGREGITADDAQLRRITGLDGKTWSKSRNIILGYFKLSGDSKWVHGRVQKTLDEVQAVREQKRFNALKRWNSDDAEALQPQCNGNANGMQSRSQKPKASKKKAAGSEYVFTGSVICLNQRDFDKLTKTFHTIPDMQAELTAIDAKFSGDPRLADNWFQTLTGWLKSRHEKNLAAEKNRQSRAEYVGV